MAVISSDPRKAAFFSEQQGFISNLEKHHASLGTLYRNIPVLPININLFSLYHCVRLRGGFNEVTRKREWNFIAQKLHYPQHTLTRVAPLLLYQYSQLLYSFEISHARMPPGNSLSVTTCLPTVIIPALYEPPIDEIQEVSLTRLRCSLLSGFPNEVELAINTLVILSSRKQVNLRHEHSLLDLLLAHIGIFNGDDLLNMFNSCGYAGKHNFNEIWYQLLPPARYLSYIESTEETAAVSEEYRNVLAPPEIAEKAACLYRLYSVATILYNSSFLEENSSFILEHNQSVRFILACLSSNNVILQHFAWDSLSIIGEKVPLCSRELNTSALLQIVTESMESEDSFILLRNLELVRCMAAAETHVEISDKITCHILRLLTINDVQLLLRCVETLYQLTETSRANCSYISTSSHGIDIIITCLTRDIDFLACYSADRFAMVKEIRLEEEVSRGIPTDMHYSISSLCDDTNLHFSAAADSKRSTPETRGFGPDEVAKKWLRSCFETCTIGTISKTQLYSGYHNYLKNIFQMQSSLGFMRLLEHIRHIFPKATLKKAIAADGKSSFVFYFLRIKQHITSEDISNPSVITSSPSSFTTPVKRKMNLTSKISPLPPLMNHHPIPNNRVLTNKFRSLADSSASTHSHNFVIKNIFNNTKAMHSKVSFSPPLKSPPPHNPVQTKLPPFPSPDTSTKMQTSPPDPSRDPMLLQIPINMLQKRPYDSPISPKQADSADSLLPEQNGHTENTLETSVPQKRSQSSSPNCILSKKPTPNSPSEIHKEFVSQSDCPVLENGDKHLVNGEVDKISWKEPADLITSQKDETHIDDNQPAADESISARVSHIENSEFPLISISLKDKTDTNPSAEIVPKAISPTIDVPSNTPTNSITDELDSSLAVKKAKKTSKPQVSVTPTCQWHSCQKSFDDWDSLLKHACNEHAQAEYPTICLWVGCKTHRNTRSRPSLMRHFQVCHCTPNPIQSKVVSVAHLLDKLKRTPPMEKHYEGVLSRSLHLTATLVLRNILLKCPESISNFAVHEDILLTVATTESQAGHYITEILSEISSFKHSKL